jgi:hypothetical protein
MTKKSYGPKSPHRGSGLLLAFAIFGLAAIFPLTTAAAPKDDTTGTVSKAEPATKQDGTPGHPYEDASQCPSSTDLVIWPNGQSIPSLPPEISVCFVGGQSFNNTDSDVQIRQR